MNEYSHICTVCISRNLQIPSSSAHSSSKTETSTQSSYKTDSYGSCKSEKSNPEIGVRDTNREGLKWQDVNPEIAGETSPSAGRVYIS